MTKRFLMRAQPFVCWLIAAAIASGFAGCAGAGSGHAPPFAKTYWTLVEMEGRPVPANVHRPPHVTFDQEKKRVTGYGGVNGFFGGYETSGNILRMPRLAATRRAGPPELMDLESAFFKALAATRSYRIADDELELLDTDGRTIARFRAERLFPSTLEK